MFSPILPIRPFLTSSTVGPKPSWLSGSADSAATSAGFLAATSAASALAKARKESFLVTKSVSQLTSMSAPVVPWMLAATTPSAVMRAAALPALLPSLTRSSSSALSMLPSASVSAFLHSIIGASVLARSSATMLAVIAAMSVFLSGGIREGCEKCADGKKGPESPFFKAGGRSGAGAFFDLDELVAAFGHGAHDVVGGAGAALEHGVGDAAGVERHGLGRVIVARDDVVDAFGRVVGVDHAHQRNAQLLGFGHGDLVEAHVDHEDGIRQAVHVLDAADVALELFHLALEHQLLFLAHRLEAAFLLRLHVLQALDGGLDRLEVGEHAAKPALVDEGHAGAAGLGGDDVACLPLGAHHQDGAAVGRQLLHELGRVLEHRKRLFQVDDVDLVAMAEDERGHLGVPEAGLVSEMDTGFQHFAHGDCHEIFLRLGLKSAPNHEACKGRRDTWMERIRDLSRRSRRHAPCVATPAKPKDSNTTPLPFPSMHDLLATRDQLVQGRTSAAAELDRALAAARSSACAHTFLSLAPERALREATAPGVQALPLAGLPVSIKDLFDVQGEVTTAGSTVLADAPPALADSAAVARLRAAGASLLGRTNMSEFAFSGVGVNPHHGTPPNPADAGTPRIPGGSSSGAAVSVATGAAFIGLGSDTGGSIRIPAALCGIVGFKNTARLTPLQGALPLSSTLDTVCAMTRSVRDAVLAHEVLAGCKVKLAGKPLSQSRFAVARTQMLDGLEPAVAQAFEAAVGTLRDAGAQVEEIALDAISDLG